MPKITITLDSKDALKIAEEYLRWHKSDTRRGQLAEAMYAQAQQVEETARVAKEVKKLAIPSRTVSDLKVGSRFTLDQVPFIVSSVQFFGDKAMVAFTPPAATSHGVVHKIMGKWVLWTLCGSEQSARVWLNQPQ